MNIKINIEFTDKEKVLLKKVLSAKTDAELTLKFEKIAAAATDEYKAMILGQNVFTRGKDMQEFRLLKLINRYFDNQIPSEQEICALFQIRANEAKGLINAITSKYQYDLEENISKTILAVLEKSVKEVKANKYPISLRSAYLKEEINRLLLIINPDLPPLERNITSGGSFLLSESSYDELVNYLSKS